MVGACVAESALVGDRAGMVLALVCCNVALDG